MRVFVFSYLLWLGSVCTVHSAPEISFEKTDYHYGTFKERAHERISYSIAVGNKGTETMKINDVRKSCGCTDVTYDTLIKPGKTGHIKPVIDLKGIRGMMTKSVTVLSNDPEKPSQKIHLKAYIIPFVHIQSRYIRLVVGNNPKKVDVFIKADIKDFKVTDMYLYNMNKGEDKGRPISIPFKLSSLNKKDKHGTHQYRLSLPPPSLNDSVYGIFVLKTNHPKRPEIRVQGAVEVVR
ncbi:MAG: DUF1573 domain-containing protein [Chitinivibrionales bacterium]|nr:DUF1573 domain-containing protein [Chitinivibrionales bacterium]